MPHTKDDFDPKAITQEHQKDIGDLKKRIEELEKKFGSHELIAETLCETADKQTKMQGMISSQLKKRSLFEFETQLEVKVPNK